MWAREVWPILSTPYIMCMVFVNWAQTVRDSSSSYTIGYFILIKNFLIPEIDQNRITGSKVTAILVKGYILPIGGVASGRVCACSLHSRLVLMDWLWLFCSTTPNSCVSHKCTWKETAWWSCSIKAANEYRWLLEIKQISQRTVR